MAIKIQLRIYTFATLVLLAAQKANAAYSSPSSLGLKPVPDGLPVGYDYSFRDGQYGVNTLLCAKPAGSLYGYIVQISLVTDKAPGSRLVGISFKCSDGTVRAAYTGGRTAALTTDIVTSAASTGGFNKVNMISGALGESRGSDGGDIVSGIQIYSQPGCGNTATTASVSGGSSNLSFGNTPRNYPWCASGNRLVGFSYSAGASFNALQFLAYAF